MKKLLFIFCLIGVLFADTSDTIKQIDKKLEIIREQKEKVLADYHRLEGAEAILMQMKQELLDSLKVKK